MRIARLLACAAMAGTLATICPVQADDSSYTYGTVWNVAYMRTETGQFENYLDYLDREFKEQCEVGQREGYLVSCRVLAVNDARAGEPDLILLTEYKDYLTTAQRKAYQDKLEAAFKASTRKLDTQYGERKVMRTPMGSLEAQELKLK